MDINEIYNNGDPKLEGKLYNTAYPENSIHEIKVVEYQGKIHIFLTDSELPSLSAMNWKPEEYTEIQKVLNIDNADIYYRTDVDDSFFIVSETYRR